MFDKLLFNNQLLANKKNVQKAKTICINKLIHKMKFLKRLKEKKPEDTKIDVKINKLLDEMKHIKRLKSIEILKKAVLNEKNPSRVITNGLALPEEVAEALLFSQKIISNIVQNLRDLLQLNSSNPSWRESVQELSKKQKKLTRIKNINEKIENRKIHKDLKRKRDEWLEENLPKDLESNSSVLESNGCSNKEDNILDRKIEDYKKTTLKMRINDKLNETRSLERSTEHYNNGKIGLKLDKKVADDDLDLDLDTIKTEDPFFVTSSGENYLSTVIIDRIQPEQPENGTIRRERRASQQKFAQKTNMRHKNQKTFKINPMKYKEKVLPFSSKSFNSKVPTLRNFNIESKKNEIHPSWAAKEKQKGIKEFSGKKITFNDENLGSKYTKSTSSNQKTLRNFNIESKKNEIHPSWAAKEKQKGIKEFSGKKITFNDENLGSKYTKSTSSNQKTLRNFNIESKKNEIHPSWAAKEKQKGIKAFSGKKIIFNDENLGSKYTKSTSSQKQAIKLSIQKESNGALHPSWSAKQKFKPVISKFEGTKIKFDDME